MHNLFSSDRMVVKGEFSHGFDEPTCHSPHRMHLYFVLQVNGKLAQHSVNLELAEASEFGTGEGLTLANWVEWYATKSLFDSLGYMLGEQNGPFGAVCPMKGWLERINDDYRYYLESREGKGCTSKSS